MNDLIALDDFLKVDIRVGRVVRAEVHPKALKPALKLRIDFGREIGEKGSSAQITGHYTPESVLGRQVMAVINLPPRRIGGFMSEVLVLGVPDTTGDVVLAAPAHAVPEGGRLY